MQDHNAPTRLAIAGLGLIGKRHAAAIEAVKGVELVAVADPSEAGCDAAATLGVPCYDDLDALFAAETPDGVILATPTSLHATQGLTCVAQDCPVLVEKPIATTIDEARGLVEAAEAAGVAVLVGHHRRHNPLIRQAHEIIAAGEIGEVRAVQAACWLYKPDAYFEVAPWRKQKGAGPISVNLVHDVDLLRYLVGEVVSVQAEAAPARRGYDNEDVAAAVLTFANGAIGTITVSDSIAAPWSWELTAGENPAYAETAQSFCQIGGSRGSLSLPDLTVWTHSDGPDWWAPISATTRPRAASDPLVNQIGHFAEVIAGRVEPLVSGREGLKTLAVIEAIQAAARTRTRVTPET